MTRFATLIAITLLLLTGSALAYIDEVYFESSIMEGEDLDVLVEGTLPDLCWEFLGWTTSAYSQMLVVNISTINPTPEASCPTVITPYEVFAVFPGLSEGTYTLRIYEDRPPLAPNVLDFTVEVTSPVAEDGDTWDAVKSLYR